jgi:meso-butanediol dehydrogenase/(S,S)-butanediol dehydrogenase/diacetyl reductase
MDRLKGKRVLVTGGTSGIGEAVVRLFVTEGAKIVFTGLLDNKGKTLENELSPNAKFIKADASKIEDVEESVKQALGFLGGLDVLVNNAGIHRGRKTIEELSKQDLDDVIKTNLYGAIYYMQKVLPHMRQGGSIINIASINGIRGVYRRPDYSASKGALIALTKQVALDYAKYGVRVNAIAFGLVLTPFAMSDIISQNELERRISKIPLGRACTPEEAAKIVMFLASDDSSFITGETITADGGVASSAYI